MRGRLVSERSGDSFIVAHVRWPGSCVGLCTRARHGRQNKRAKWRRRAAQGPHALAGGGRRPRRFIVWRSAAVGETQGGWAGGAGGAALTRMPAKLVHTKVYVFLHWAASKPVSPTWAPSRYEVWHRAEHGGRQ